MQRRWAGFPGVSRSGCFPIALSASVRLSAITLPTRASVRSHRNPVPSCHNTNRESWMARKGS